MTSAERSTLRRAWIFPLAVTLATRSTLSTLAVVTFGTFLSLPRMDPRRTIPRIAATATPIRIFHFFDIARSSLGQKETLTLLLFTRAGGESSRRLGRWNWC